MAISKQLTLKVAPWMGTDDQHQTFADIHELLSDEKDDELKESELVSSPYAFEVIIEFYQIEDDRNLEKYWADRYYQEYPHKIMSRIYHLMSEMAKNVKIIIICHKMRIFWSGVMRHSTRSKVVSQDLILIFHMSYLITIQRTGPMKKRS